MGLSNKTHGDAWSLARMGKHGGDPGGQSSPPRQCCVEWITDMMDSLSFIPAEELKRKIWLKGQGLVTMLPSRDRTMQRLTQLHICGVDAVMKVEGHSATWLWSVCKQTGRGWQWPCSPSLLRFGPFWLQKNSTMLSPPSEDNRLTFLYVPSVAA